MSGATTIIIYAVGRGEELVADSLTFPVDAIIAKELNAFFEEQRSRGKLKITITGEPGTRVSLAGVSSQTHNLQLDNDLTKSMVSIITLHVHNINLIV